MDHDCNYQQAHLRQHLTSREVALGLQTAEVMLEDIEQADSGEMGQIRLLAEIVNWIDFRFAIRDRVEKIVRRWPEADRRDLRHEHALLLRFIEGVLALHNERFNNAATRFEQVIGEKIALADSQLVFRASFYKARCDFYREDYDAVERFCKDEAAGLVEGLDHGELQLAVVDILRSRVMIKTKPVRELQQARNLLLRAQAVFNETDDYVTRGNIRAFLALAAKRGLHEV